MKKVLFFTRLILIVFPAFCYGQVNEIRINDLNIPTSPAFVIMDKSPASIEKPSNPKALAVSLINLWEGNGALEFAPYWFKNRPAYTFEENLKKKMPVFQTLGFSAATSKKDTITNIAGGFRTQLFRIYSDTLQKEILKVKAEIVDLLSQEDPETIDMEAVEKAKKELFSLQSRTTFNLELAGAYMGQSSSSKTLASSKAGAWLNLRWTPYKFPLDIVLLARFSRANQITAKAGRDSTFFDYGLNFSYRDETRNFELQMEYVNRRDLFIKENYDHFALVANYQIIPGIVAVASIGNDFKKVTHVFALIGLKFGISKEVAKLQ